MGFYAVFVPCCMAFCTCRDVIYDWDCATLFTDEEELDKFIREMVERHGEECIWDLNSIERVIKDLLDGYEDDCFGRVIYPTLHK